jgi:hypothetical protein
MGNRPIPISFRPTPDGGYIISVHSGLIKTDAEGNILWEKDLQGLPASNSDSIQLTSDGGYILVGLAGNIGSLDDREFSAAWLIKTDAEGNELWNRTFGGKEDDKAQSVQLTSDGGYILAGIIDSYGDKDSAWLIKTDAQGNAPSYPQGD